VSSTQASLDSLEESPSVEKFVVDGVSLRGTLRLPIKLLEDGRPH
jgi:hypothetical protein